MESLQSIEQKKTLPFFATFVFDRRDDSIVSDNIEKGDFNAESMQQSFVLLGDHSGIHFASLPGEDHVTLREHLKAKVGGSLENFGEGYLFFSGNTLFLSQMNAPGMEPFHISRKELKEMLREKFGQEYQIVIGED